jgi:hypothetical protein
MGKNVIFIKSLEAFFPSASGRGINLSNQCGSGGSQNHVAKSSSGGLPRESLRAIMPMRSQ